MNVRPDPLFIPFLSFVILASITGCSPSIHGVLPNSTQSPILQVSPTTLTVTVGNTIQFTALNTTPPYTFELLSNLSGGNINPSTGAYTAGITSGVNDVIQLKDATNTTAIATITVNPALELSPTSSTVAVGNGLSFSTTGGAGAKTYRISTNLSGGSIHPSTGAYVAGPTSGVTDTIEVIDSYSNTVTATVTVNPALTLNATHISTFAGAFLQLTSTGGVGAKTYSITTNNSGGSINSSTGAYFAGTTTGINDTVEVEDSIGNISSATVTVSDEPFVQRASWEGYPGALTNSMSATLAAPITQGNFILVYTAWGTSANKPTVVSDGTNSFTEVANTYVADAPHMQWNNAYIYPNHPGGTQTITVTWAEGHQWRGLVVAEYQYVKLAAPIDVVKTNLQATPGTGSNAITSGTIATSAAAIITGFTQATVDLTGVLSGGTNFTKRTVSNLIPFEDRILGLPTASTAVTFTTTSTTNYYLTNLVAIQLETNLALHPSTASIAASGTRLFKPWGGKAPYTFTIVTNNSGGSIHPTTGLYSAGTNAGTSDTIQVTDANNTSVTSTVSVNPS